MNTYKILTFDGYNSRSILVNGYDIVGAIQSNGSIIQSQVVKAELVENENKENYTV